MVRVMKAILIDPISKTVTPVEVDGTLEGFYKILKCSIIEPARAPLLAGKDFIYMDEEAMLKFIDDDDQFFFSVHNYGIIAGRGIVTAVDEQGESTDCVSTLELVKSMVEFEE